MGNAEAAAVVTVSDGVTNGTRVDASGDLAERLLRDAGFDVDVRIVVPDERDRIEAALVETASSHGLVVTTGGTGFGPRDITPEATRNVIDREAPGLAELMRRGGLEHTPMAALSRAIVGSLGSTLIVNLPGSQRAVEESLEAILPVVRHAVELLGGSAGSHPTGHAAEDFAQGDVARSPERIGVPEGSVAITAVRQIGAPPCPVGARIVVGAGGPLEGTLGCAEFDSAAVQAAAEVLASGSGPQTRMFHHDLGDIEVFVEPHPTRPLLVVMSATPVARELMRIGRRLGYRSLLVESRGERVSAKDRGTADEVTDSLDRVQIDARTSAIHTDHDAPGVAESIATLLRSPAGFIGVMGSRRHVGPYVERLRAMGFADDDLGRVRSPVGIDIGAKTPEEIALSIAAGIVAARSGRDGGWLDGR